MSLNSEVVHVLEMFGIPLPGGDSLTLDSLAGSWSTMADALDAQNGALASAVDSITPDQWQGAAYEAFCTKFQALSQAMTAGSANFRNVSTCLKQYAQTVDSMNEQIVGIAEQILLITAAGAAMSLFTFGGSDAAAAAEDAVEAGRIAKLVDEFVQWARDAAEAIKEFLGISQKMAEVIADFAKNFVADSGSNILNQGLNGKPITWSQDFADGAVDAYGTAALGSVLSPGFKEANPLLSGSVTNMAGTLLESRFDGDSWQGTVENMAVSGGTGALGTKLGQGDGDGEGSGVPEATEPEKLGINTLVYTGGDIGESDMNTLAGRIKSVLGGPAVGGDQMPTVPPAGDPGTISA